MWFKIFSMLFRGFSHYCMEKLRFSHYCMHFLVTRKLWKGFSSNFQLLLCLSNSKLFLYFHLCTVIELHFLTIGFALHSMEHIPTETHTHECRNAHTCAHAKPWSTARTEIRTHSHTHICPLTQSGAYICTLLACSHSRRCTHSYAYTCSHVSTWTFVHAPKVAHTLNCMYYVHTRAYASIHLRIFSHTCICACQRIATGLGISSILHALRLWYLTHRLNLADLLHYILIQYTHFSVESLQ